MSTLKKIALLIGIITSISSFPAYGADRHIVIVNDTSYTLVSIYASNIGSESWEEDLLQRGTLAPGGKVRANIDDGTGYCRYDLKAVFNNGASAIKRNVNVCQIETWTIHDE